MSAECPSYRVPTFISALVSVSRGTSKDSGTAKKLHHRFNLSSDNQCKMKLFFPLRLSLSRTYQSFRLTKDIWERRDIYFLVEGLIDSFFPWCCGSLCTGCCTHDYHCCIIVYSYFLCYSFKLFPIKYTHVQTMCGSVFHFSFDDDDWP